jgi:glycosyltransferase involved in cell wall biosynthesis
MPARSQTEIHVDADQTRDEGLREHSKPARPPRPLRVLFIHSSRSESNEYRVHQLLAESADPDHVDSMFVWQSSTVDPANNIVPQLARPDRVFHYDFGRDVGLPVAPSHRRRGLMTISRLPAGMWRVARRIRAFKPDVLYTTQQRHEVFVAHQMARLFRVPHVIHICYEVGPWLGDRTYKTILANDHIIGSCQFVQDSVTKRGVPVERTEHIHHVADANTYDVPHDDRYLRDELGFDDDSPIIVSAARLDEGKGFVLLLEGFALLLRDMPKARLVIAGVPSQGTNFDVAIHAKVRELGLEDAVRFVGHRGDLPQVFGGADLFALPLESDAVSLVFLGAMMARLPCVSIRSGSVPEVVLDGQTGLLSDPNDPAGLATNMRTILSDGELATTMGERGREYATTHFSPENISNWWLEILFRRFGHLVQSPVGE